MPALLALLLPALVPALADGLRGIFSWATGGAGMRPQNVDEAIKLMSADVEKLKALALLDQPAANISPWVANLRASFRYLAGGLIIIATMGMVGAKGYGVAVPDSSLDFFQQLSGSVFAFLFGDRMYSHFKGK